MFFFVLLIIILFYALSLSVFCVAVFLWY